MQKKQKNMTVRDLKNILKDIPDDTPVIIPVITEENADTILGFRYVRTAGILENDNESNAAFCLNSSNENSIQEQIKSYDTICKKVLF